jgi:hypothetical protein
VGASSPDPEWPKAQHPSVQTLGGPALRAVGPFAGAILTLRIPEPPGQRTFEKKAGSNADPGQGRRNAHAGLINLGIGGRRCNCGNLKRSFDGG